MTNRDLFAKHVGLGTFVETGTAYGRSVNIAVQLGFTDIRSVEGDITRFTHCKALFRNDPGVLLWCGESVEWLPTMLAGLDKPILVFLDAHPSGDGSYGQDYPENPAHEQSSILRFELELLHKRNVKGDVILIDDLSDDIKAFALKLFRGATIQIYDTDEGKDKVMEIVT